MNKIFIHSYLVRVSRVAEEVTQPCFDRLLLLLLLVLSRCCWCYTLSRICNNSISRARRWAAASAAAAAAATSRSTLELSAVTIDNISWQLSRIAHAACFSPAVALSYMWQARGKQFNIGPANPFPSPSLPSPSPPISRQFFKNNFPLQLTVKIRTSGYQTPECFIENTPNSGRLVQVGETHLQIWSCQLYRNAFDGRAPPGPAEGAIALPQTL